MEPLLEKSYEQLLKMLSEKDYRGAEGAQTLITAVNVKLTHEVGDKLHGLGEVIGASASQVGSGAKFVGESVDKFRDATVNANDKLVDALDNLRQSTDRSSCRMIWLNVGLLFAALIYTAATVYNVYVVQHQLGSSDIKVENRPSMESLVEPKK